MMLRLLLGFLMIGVLATNLYSQKSESNPFTIKWDNGFKVDSEDNNFKLKFGGRLMLDHAYFYQNEELDSSFGELESNNGTEFRRARLFVSGTIYKNVEFKLNVDFAGGVALLKDAYLGIKNVPVIGRVRIGHIKEPLRFDALTSSKYITFMERAIPADIANERNNGILIMNDFLNNKLSIQTGVFRNADDFGNDKKAANDFASTSRISSLIINNIEKEQLLHLGVSYSYRIPDDENYALTLRPKSHLSKKYITTGIIPDVSKVHIINLETAYTYGSFTLQGEFLNSKVYRKSPDTSENYDFFNYYGQMSYFLTGEHRPFKNSYATFGRLKPKNHFMNGNKGAGALEFAIRYTHTNFNSKDILGGEQSDITFGTNWYLNSATRIMFNYVWTDINRKDVGGGILHIFEMRFQIDF